MKTKFYILKNNAKLLAVLTLFVGYAEVNAQGFVYPVNDTDLAIPENTDFAASTMIVSGIPEDHHIYYAAVGVKLDHTYAGDLVLLVQAPGGDALGLMHRPGSDALTGEPLGNNANFSPDNLMVFTDYSETSSELIGDGLGSAQIIPAGHYLPSWNVLELDAEFTSFINLAQTYTGLKNGEWDIHIKDVMNGDTGTLSLVEMLINYDRYCVPFLNNNSEHITNVTFPGLNYSTGALDYDHPDYHTTALGHGITDPLIQGETYPISVSIDPDQNDYIYVFADWNQDGDFDDADETYTIASNVSTAGPHIANITVPTEAFLGETRMRVALQYQQSTPNPCFSQTSTTPGYGETEDFTALIVESMGVNDLTANDKTTVHPNPIVDEVNFTSKNTISQVNIYNVNGQEVMKQNANAQTLKLNVSNLTLGVYVAKIKTDKGTETIKLIKK